MAIQNREEGGAGGGLSIFFMSGPKMYPININFVFKFIHTSVDIFLKLQYQYSAHIKIWALYWYCNLLRHVTSKIYKNMGAILVMQFTWTRQCIEVYTSMRQ